MNNKDLSLLSIMAKAGMLCSGEYQCEDAIKSGKAHLLIIAADASDGTKKKFTDMAKYYGVEFITASDKEELGRRIGKDLRALICVKDETMAQRLLINKG